jgi:DNA replication factor GINS
VDSYQNLRKIQKKERDNGTLAQVEETFYEDIHNYINELKQSAIDDPFSDVYNTLNEAKRIATEICERREHKITNVAVLNMNRSYQLFSGKQDFDLVDSMPLNMTPEEETFYFSIIETLKNHRLTLSGQSIKDSSVEEDDVSDVENKPDNAESAPLSGMDDSKEEVLEKIDETLENEDKSLKSGDEVLDRLDEISKAKVIDDEVRQPIEKQISKSSIKAPGAKKNISKTPSEFDDIEILDGENQFIDLDMPKRTRESEIVTILVLDKIDSIVGIDEKVYGPFRPQDIVLLPKINANIFVKNRKARFVKI